MGITNDTCLTGHAPTRKSWAGRTANACSTPLTTRLSTGARLTTEALRSLGGAGYSSATLLPESSRSSTGGTSAVVGRTETISCSVQVNFDEHFGLISSFEPLAMMA